MYQSIVSFEESQANKSCKDDKVILDKEECKLAASLIGLEWFGADRENNGIETEPIGEHWPRGCSYHLTNSSAEPGTDNLMNKVAFKYEKGKTYEDWTHRTICKGPRKTAL